MNVRMPFFSLKIETSKISDYTYQLVFFTLSLPALYYLNWAAIPLLILIYLILNFIRNSIT